MPTEINAADYGVTCNGTTDDTAALQSAINAAQSANLPLAIQGGTCILSGPVSITQDLWLRGAGKLATTLKLTGTNQAGIVVSTISAVHVEKLEIAGNGGPNLTGIIVTAPSGNCNQGSTFRDVAFTDIALGIDFQNAATWIIDGGLFVFQSGGWIGVRVANAASPDTGDSAISNSFFWASGVPGSIGIEQYSSGGLKIINAKFNGWTYGYRLNLAAVTTSDLLISNSSFENQNQSGIAFTRQSSSGAFSNVTVTGNQFSLSPMAVQQIDTSAGWLGQITVVGCVGCSGKISLPSATNTQIGNL
jgi:hypothetical protein